MAPPAQPPQPDPVAAETASPVDADRVATEPMITLPPAFEMPILPSLFDAAPQRPRSLRERLFPLRVGS
ncbi:MAG: hypothetical protein FJ102_24825 [Deltaproteobacteria bacterium]|nr:hypothetical protein [Deltaproteobacteria bacterium]